MATITEEIFDNCDAINNWKIYSGKAVPEQGDNTLEVDTVDKFEGIGSLKGVFGATAPNWGGAFYKRPTIGIGWDFSQKPVVKIRIKSDKPFPAGAEVQFGIVTGATYDDWDGFNFDIKALIPIGGTYAEIELDLRKGYIPRADGKQPLLSSVRQIAVGLWNAYISVPITIHWDYITRMAGAEIPLEVSLSPKSASMVIGDIGTFTTYVLGGVSPYNFAWYLDEQLQSETSDKFTYMASTIGVHVLKCTVRDSLGNTVTTNQATIEVREAPVIVEPRMLHVDGRHLYDDRGQRRHLHGVCFNNFTDSSVGWFPGGSYVNWDEQAAKRTLDALAKWRCDVITCYQLYDWLNRNARATAGGENQTDIGNLDALKRFIALAYQYGVYVGVGIYAISLSILGNPVTPQWIAEHKAEWVAFWLKISRELRVYPNVFYMFIGEPAANETIMNAYFQACVEAGQAVRNDGDEHIFMYHEGYCGTPVYVDANGNPIRRLWESITNVVIDFHLYRWHGTFGNNPDVYTGGSGGSNQDGVYRYADVRNVMMDASNGMLLRKFLEAYNVPLFMWEAGMNYGVTTPNTVQKELECYESVLKVCIEEDIGWGAFWWRYALGWDLWRNLSTFLPTEYGQLVINANTEVQGEPPPPPPPPPDTCKLTIVATTGGTTEPAPGAYTTEVGSIITVTAIPNEGYSFKRFELDGEVKMQNPVNVGMDTDRTLLAVFDVAAPPISPAVLLLALLVPTGVGVALSKKGGE